MCRSILYIITMTVILLLQSRRLTFQKKVIKLIFQYRYLLSNINYYTNNIMYSHDGGRQFARWYYCNGTVVEYSKLLPMSYGTRFTQLKCVIMLKCRPVRKYTSQSSSFKMCIILSGRQTRTMCCLRLTSA